MAQKIVKLKLDRDDNYLYWIEQDGNVWRILRKTEDEKKPKMPTRAFVSTTLKISEENWERFVYFLDKDGDVSRARRSKKKGAKKDKKKSAKKKLVKKNKKRFIKVKKSSIKAPKKKRSSK